jgi:hypothetical protein
MNGGSMSESGSGYWSMDIPGLTRSQALEMSSILRDRWEGLNPNPVDPATFLTLHMDRESADVIRTALSKVSGESRLIADGLRELIEEWLVATTDSQI